MTEENESKSSHKTVNKSATSTEKYHVVRAKDPKEVAKYIMPCPADKLNNEGESPVREFLQLHIFCANFKNSAHVTDRKQYTINWETIKEGVEGGMVEGLEL